jgi:hypothetical protein
VRGGGGHMVAKQRAARAACDAGVLWPLKTREWGHRQVGLRP